MTLNRAVVVGFLLFGLVSGGLVVRHGDGRGGKVRAVAAVISCHYDEGAGTAGGHEECDGFWNTKGDPVNGTGRHVNGTIDGARPRDIGRDLAVYASGDHAATPHGTN